MASTTKSSLLTKVISDEPGSSNRISIIGVGQVGIACAVVILVQSISNEVILFDSFPDKLRGECLNLQHGALFMNCPKISHSCSYPDTAGSRICIITAGVRQKEGETRLDLAQRNIDLMKSIIPEVAKYSPNAILIVASNPVDILSYAAWKLSGFPKHRIIGSGTALDSSRLRFYMSERLGVSVDSCYGLVLGEHGTSCVTVWSSANVAGARLQDINLKIGTPEDPENWSDVHKKVVGAGREVRNLKGYTNWAIGLSCASITNSILKNSMTVLPVSVHALGLQGIKHDVYLSLPAVIGTDGVSSVINLHLTDSEQHALEASAKIIHDIQSKYKF